MGVYVHKSVLELADLTNREKLVLAYFFNFMSVLFLRFYKCGEDIFY